MKEKKQRDPLRTVNIQELCVIFDISRITAQDWISKGMPVQKASTGPGVSAELNVGECVRWYINRLKKRKEDRSPAARKLEIEAELLELELKEKRDMTVDVADAAETVAEILKIVNTSLRGFGHSLETRHGYTADEAAILEKTLDIARRELADEMREQLQALKDQANAAQQAD